MRSLITILLPVSFMLAFTTVTAMTTHPLEDIREAATSHVRANFANSYNAKDNSAKKNNDVHITAKALDPRLKLPLCKQELIAHMPYANRKSSNTTVGIRCEGEQPWSLYVPVTIQIYRNIAVASRPLARGKILGNDDVEMQRMDISRLSGGYLGTADIAIGQLLTRPIQIGQPLLSNILKAPTIIRRGQTITMLAKRSTFEVRSMGESLMDGAVGERIKVRNHRSKRIVEGVIGKNGIVFVN